jgi:hypothetical protein
MDYESDVNDAEKNTTFKRQIFVKSQWDTMIGNIKFKSREASLPRGYESELSDNNPYIDGSDEDEKLRFINALNNILR